ncbi:MAG: RlmE family RNA methyltransferase [Spirochaetales bacterium]|nr:RlmE family RNA methyltransferase [Spirochaetales bacterium]
MRRDQDHFARMAKQQGFPARSVFKLQEMQERFHLLRPGCRVLDVGAAPGSWSRFCLERVGCRVVAVDLVEVSLGPRHGPQEFRFVQGSILDPEVAALLVATGPYDAVLSDAAPATSGASLVDTEASLELARRVMEVARSCLKPGGNLAIKVFQSGGEVEVLRRMKNLFARARAFKPGASRRESRETYLLGFSYLQKSPKKT